MTNSRAFRSVLPLALLAALVGACSDPDPIADDPPVDDPPGDDDPADPVGLDLGATRLIVADTEANVVIVHDGKSELARFDNVGMNSHAGFLALPDGRVLLVDELNGRLLTLDLAATPPKIAAEVAVRKPTIHLAVDPGAKVAVVSALLGEAQQALTLVDLASYETSSVELPGGEPGILIGGEPLTLFLRDGAEASAARAHRVSDLRQGKVEPVYEQAIGGWGHGDVIDHERSAMYLAVDEGMRILPFTSTGFGEMETVSWNTAERSGGRAYFMRLSSDGDRLYSYVRNTFYPEERPWTEWENDVWIFDATTNAVTRIPVGGGLVYRGAQMADLALYVHMAASGDKVLLVDKSNTIRSRIDIPAMTMAAGPTDSPWETPAFRANALSPDGKWGFVSAGGDGEVVVIDTVAGTVAGRIETGTPLDFGGYLFAYAPGTALVDTIGR